MYFFFANEMRKHWEQDDVITSLENIGDNFIQMIFFFLSLSLCLSSSLNLPFSLSLSYNFLLSIFLSLFHLFSHSDSLSISLNFLFLVGYVFLFNSFLVSLFLALYFFFSSDFFFFTCMLFRFPLPHTLFLSLSLPNHPTPSLSFYDLHCILFINVDTLLPPTRRDQNILVQE